MTENLTPAPAKRKAMVYVPDDVHRAMEHMAVERGSSVSDLYVAAARAFLDAGGSRSPPAKPSPVPPPMSAEVTASIEQAMARILARLDGMDRVAPPAGTTSLTSVDARAMAVTLDALTRAGTEGLHRESLLAILGNEGMTRETGVSILFTLRENGLVGTDRYRIVLRDHARTRQEIPVPVSRGRGRTG